MQAARYRCRHIVRLIERGTIPAQRVAWLRFFLTLAGPLIAPGFRIAGNGPIVLNRQYGVLRPATGVEQELYRSPDHEVSPFGSSISQRDSTVTGSCP